MPIQLNDNAPASTPVLRHQRIGEVAMLAIVDHEQRDRLAKNPATQQLEKIPAGTKADGSIKYKQELVVHCLALPGTTMQYKAGDEFRTPEPGDRVRLILKGQGFGRWIDARKAHRGGSLNVGDVLITGTDQAQAYDQNGAPKGPPIKTQAEADRVPRGVTVGFYGPIEIAEPPDPRWTEAAEQAHIAAKKAAQAAKAIPLEEAPASRSWLDDEVAF